jgi:hypothetical protein
VSVGAPTRRVGLETVRASDPVVAWRAWGLTGHGDGTGLLLRPVAKRARTWRPLEVVAATCRTARWHEAPDPTCTCGLHGTHGVELLRKTRCPAVLGRVAMWGRVVEHELGFRARYAYPQRLALICQFCFWRAGLHAPAPRHVGRYARDRLLPLCDEHLRVARRHGLPPRTVLPADVVAQGLLDTYAVDMLPA